MRRRPRLVLFDAVETVFSLRPVDAALQPLGVNVDAYFDRLLRDGFALAAAGSYRRFDEVAAAALGAVADAPREAQAAVQDAFTRLPAHPDAEPAMAALCDAGVAVATLTNGAADATQALLEANGLDHYVGRVLSVDSVHRWKPSPEPYRHTLSVLGFDEADTALVAVHSWDINGAHRAGLTTGWCSRLEHSYPPIFDPPDVEGADLIAVTEGLLRLAS